MRRLSLINSMVGPVFFRPSLSIPGFIWLRDILASPDTSSISKLVKETPRLNTHTVWRVDLWCSINMLWLKKTNIEKPAITQIKRPHYQIWVIYPPRFRINALTHTLAWKRHGVAPFGSFVVDDKYVGSWSYLTNYYNVGNVYCASQYCQQWLIYENIWEHRSSSSKRN